jgi:hypothetical protein
MSSRRKTLVTAAGQVWKKRVLNDKLVRASLAANPLPAADAHVDSDSDAETKYDNEIDRLYSKALRRATAPKKVPPVSVALALTATTIPTPTTAPNLKKRANISSATKGRRRGLLPQRIASTKPENIEDLVEEATAASGVKNSIPLSKKSKKGGT